jgi:4'-phosphopantetheinyl transferase
VAVDPRAGARGLAAGEIHIFEISLIGAVDRHGAELAALERMLDDEERERANRFVLEADRRRFVLAHAALRSCLALYWGGPPERLRFHYGPFGKPALKPEARGQTPLCFNLSHSRSLALLAVARREVGVDVEDLDREVDELAIGLQCLSPREQLALAARPAGRQRRAAFFSLWTRKEALLKGLGTGFSRDPTTIDLGPATDQGPDRATWIDPLSEHTWTVAGVALGPRHRAALAVGAAFDELTRVRRQLLPLTPDRLVSGCRAV